ncbi:MAG: hypothetical protein H0W50_07000 [Parachlamydiaceae bacterium]|nr:hypothetical protein [Parachlamydiaceae bacterium]
MKTLKPITSIISVCRRYVLLLEVLIAMVLTMVLLSVLLSFYLQINKVNAAQELEQEHSFGKLFLSTRLASIIPRVVPVNNPDKDYIFFSTLNNDSETKPGTPSLFFTFDNGVKLDPDFSNHVLGRLYLSNGKLSLAIWPSTTRWSETEVPPIKNEVLFDGVEDLSFMFYLPPSRQRKIVLANRKTVFTETNLMKIETMGEWKTEWQQEYGDLPALVRIILAVKSKSKPGTLEPIVLTYPLPNSFEVIVYEQ